MLSAAVFFVECVFSDCGKKIFDDGGRHDLQQPDDAVRRPQSGRAGYEKHCRPPGRKQVRLQGECFAGEKKSLSARTAAVIVCRQPVAG